MKQRSFAVARLSREDMKVIKGGGRSNAVAAHCGGFTELGCRRKCLAWGAGNWQCTPTACECLD